ncbi:MAG: hypothetical protein HYY32_02280 [Chloroflexi bacterium]|nr:hypothetical protein [Chloroflexota bacterium]
MKPKEQALPFLWSGLIYVLCLGLAYLAVRSETRAIETGQIPPLPTVSAGQAGFPIAYFFAVVVLLGVFLFLIPVSRLKLVLRVLFGFAFAWGSFVLFWLLLQHSPPATLNSVTIIAAVAALAVAAVWLWRPAIWLHDILLMFTLVSMASVFGVIFSPWTAIVIMAMISVYDFIAVRFGYMQWMARKLSESDTLPAFFVPYSAGNWNASLKAAALKRLFERAGEKEFSVLGGGDIGFPLLLVVSVLDTSGPGKGMIVAGFSLMGLAAAYLVLILVMKGRPTPALPPIFALSLAGFLLVNFVL